MEDKREWERIDLVGSVSGEVTMLQSMLVRQISRGGMEIETEFPVPLGSLHDFRLPLGNRSVVVRGRVVHSRIADVDHDIVTYRSGIEFVDKSDHTEAALGEFIAALNAKGRTT